MVRNLKTILYFNWGADKIQIGFGDLCYYLTQSISNMKYALSSFFIQRQFEVYLKTNQRQFEVYLAFLFIKKREQKKMNW